MIGDARARTRLEARALAGRAPRRAPPVVPVWALLLVVAVACGGSEPAPPPERVTGLITELGRGDDGAIESFTVREDGRTFRILIGPRRDYGFNPEYLEEHRASDWPVRVRLEQRTDGLYAVEILDA